MKKPTFTEHLVFGKQTRIISRMLMGMHVTLANSLGKTHPAVKHLARTTGCFNKFKQAIEIEYCMVTTDEQLSECGFIYYTGGKCRTAPEGTAAVTTACEKLNELGYVWDGDSWIIGEENNDHAL